MNNFFTAVHSSEYYLFFNLSNFFLYQFEFFHHFFLIKKNLLKTLFLSQFLNISLPIFFGGFKDQLPFIKNFFLLAERNGFMTLGLINRKEKIFYNTARISIFKKSILVRKFNKNLISKSKNILFKTFYLGNNFILIKSKLNCIEMINTYLKFSSEERFIKA